MVGKFRTFLKKNVAYLYLGGGACAGLAILYPNTVGIEKYKNLMAVHTKDGKVEQVDTEFIKLADEIKRDFGWTKDTMESSETVALFTSSSFELTHIGTSKMKWGGHIGIPKYYFVKFQQDDEKDLDEILASLKIKRISEAAREIKESYSISAEAKKFGLAREMKLSKSYQLYCILVGAQLAVGSFYIVPNIVSAILPFPGVKFITFLSLFPLCLFGFLNVLKGSTRIINSNADKAAANISNEIASGGLEYYDAMLVREKWLQQDNKEKFDGLGLFQAILQKPWNDSFLTIRERKENLEQFIAANKTDVQS